MTEKFIYVCLLVAFYMGIVFVSYHWLHWPLDITIPAGFVGLIAPAGTNWYKRLVHDKKR